MMAATISRARRALPGRGRGLRAVALGVAGVLLCGAAPATEGAGPVAALLRGATVRAMVPAVPAALGVPTASTVPGWPREVSPAMQDSSAAQDEFVPIDELPPEERLPAAPFLVAAYTITLVLLAGYVWLLWRRLETVRRELHDARAAAGARADSRTEGP